MVSITLSVPEEIKKRMKEFPEVNWSAIARKSITDQVDRLTLRQELLKKLEAEKEDSDWAVKLIREDRHARSARH